MGSGAAHRSACFTALSAPGWVKPSWDLGWGTGLEAGWALLGASHPHGSSCSLWPASRSRAACAGDRAPSGPRPCV